MRRGDARLPLSNTNPSSTELRAAPVGLSHIRRQHDVLRGILLMCAGVAMFPFMNAAVKLLGPHYPVTQIVWARFTGHLIVMLIVFLPRYGRRLLATRRPGVQIGRSLLMLVSNMMFVVAIAVGVSSMTMTRVAALIAAQVSASPNLA